MRGNLRWLFAANENDHGSQADACKPRMNWVFENGTEHDQWRFWKAVGYLNVDYRRYCSKSYGRLSGVLLEQSWLVAEVARLQAFQIVDSPVKS